MIKSKLPKSSALSRDIFIPDLCNIQAVLFLVLGAQLLSFVLELADNGLKDFNWFSLSLTSLFVQWSFLSCATCLCALRSTLSCWSVAKAMVISYLVIITVVLVLSIAGQWLLNGAFNGSGNWTLDGLALLTNILICAVLTGIVFRYFYLSQQLQVRQQAELQARIQALQSRIRPHFLFNSMNIIASLIAVDQDAAETAVEDLASLFRASLAEVATQVTLAEELELCRRYTHIEQLRLGNRLQLDWQVSHVPQTLNIPSLVLQPLLENAIYHGIQKLPDGGTVTVSADFQNNILTLCVINPVPDNHNNYRHENGNHIALENIHDRLQALYGEQAGLTTVESSREHKAIIQYPVLNAQ